MPRTQAVITDIEDYFAKGCGRCPRFATSDCSTRRWADGLGQLRRICREAGLVETVRWGHPCYRHADRNIVLIGALRAEFRLSFMQAALLKDSRKLLEKAGPNTQVRSLMRFTENSQVIEQEAVIRAYLLESMHYADAGIRPEKVQQSIQLPAELRDALAADPELSAAFHRLTPGRQRSYVIHIGNARRSATRVARIAKSRDAILSGRGALERPR